MQAVPAVRAWLAARGAVEPAVAVLAYLDRHDQRDAASVSAPVISSACLDIWDWMYAGLAAMVRPAFSRGCAWSGAGWSVRASGLGDVRGDDRAIGHGVSAHVGLDAAVGLRGADAH